MILEVPKNDGCCWIMKWHRNRLRLNMQLIWGFILVCFILSYASTRRYKPKEEVPTEKIDEKSPEALQQPPAMENDTAKTHLKYVDTPLSMQYVCDCAGASHIPPGQNFTIKQQYLTHTELAVEEFESMAVMREFVFVTVMTAGVQARKSLLRTIASIQTHFSGRSILVYDLLGGPETNQKREVAQLCGVKFITFPYAEYPKHVKNYNIFAWRPLVIQAALKMYSSVFWLSPSQILTTNNLTLVLTRLTHTQGIALLHTENMSPWAVTRAHMYNYIPTIQGTLRRIQFANTDALLIQRTSAVYINILRWWVMCALEEHCINPPGASPGCVFSTSKFTESANCHMYDQSALNILLANYFSFLETRYVAGRGVSVRDPSQGTMVPVVCLNDRR